MNTRHTSPPAARLALAFVLAAVPAMAAAIQDTQDARETQIKPAASSPWTPSRTPDGQPDVQGFWVAADSGTYDLADPKTGGARLDELLSGNKRAAKPSRIVDPADGKVPYQAWALAKQKEIEKHVDDPTRPEHIDTQARCLPGGVPRTTFHSQFRILQPPGFVILLHENNHTWRVIPLDGRPHAGPNTKLWMGDSRGHWDGTTLIVDVTNLNGKARFDMIGDFASDAVHITETWRFADAKTVSYEVHVEDASVYTRPWTIVSKLKRRDNGPGYELWEDACHEGERSADEMIRRAAPKKTSRSSN
jgi:hypothetical protein